MYATKRLLAAAALLSFSLVPAFAADTLESIEKASTENWGKIKTFSATMDSVQSREQGGMSMTGSSKGTIEYSNSGKMFYRMEMTSSQAMKTPQGEQKMDGSSLMIFDGEFMWVQQDMMGQKQAFKMKPPQEDPLGMGGEPLWKSMKETFTLTLVGDEEVDGRATHVIEGAPIGDAALELGKAKFNFDKETGISIRQEMFDKAGKSVGVTKLTNMKTNSEIAADRFKYTAPEGVQVQDMSAAQPAAEPAPAPAPAPAK